ncbi:DUF5686 family protein [uncultured Bacteroides sp.]|uniref:DUF5686 family protein n=1 Tax=uncultured Bacteroides sp. TaxID=162156 RepID=UPI0026267680|nr:DUF5686 family protein [uncultured Bacteroides sp.]
MVCAVVFVHGMANDKISSVSRSYYVPDSIMDHIFDSAEKYATQIKEYEAVLYLKGRMKIHKRNRIIKYIPSMFRFEKGINDYIHESISDLHYTAPRIYDRKITAVATTFPGGYSRFFDILDFLQFNIYAPSVMANKILSPLYRKSSIHYYYLLDSVDYRMEGIQYKVRVIPRYRSTQLMEGFFWISSSDWSIRYMDFIGKYDLTSFHLSMQMGEEGESRFLPHLLNLDVIFKFVRNKLEMNYTGWLNFKNIKFMSDEEVLRLQEGDQKYNLSKSYRLTADTTKLIQDRDSFTRIRPLPLSDSEDSLYRAFDKRRTVSVDDTLQKPQTKLKRNLVFMGQLGDALISSYDIDFSKLGNISCSPLINPFLVSYSHRNGWAYRQVFKYNKLFHDGKLLRLIPQVGYNFTKKELYAKLDGEFVYNPKKHGAITLNVGNGNRIYSSVVLDQLKSIPDSTFSFNGLELDYFKDIYLNIAHNVEVVNGLSLWTGLSMHWRKAVHGTPEVAKRVPLKYNSFAPRLRIEWTPGMYYYMNGNRKMNIGSTYPTFVADYECGLKVLPHSGKYHRLELSAEQQIRIRNLHSIAYHVGGGFFSNQREMYFVDYVDFANRNLPQGWNDDIGGAFQMLDGRWYNASRHYVRGNITYETPFLLLYPVSRLLSFIQKERIYAGVLFMPHLNPYLELGYGFGTHVFDFGVFIGNEQGKFTSVGCKFTFELFNR